MSRNLDKAALSSLIQAGRIESLTLEELAALFREDDLLSEHLPDGRYQIDPRNGDRILYHSSRARRPHDSRSRARTTPSEDPECAICEGRTTGVLDVADLSEGYTFINKNLYPILYPIHPEAPTENQGREATPRLAYGFHFLQWTSSWHDRDWHNLPVSDCLIVMERLVALERKLISGGLDSLRVPDAKAGPLSSSGFVSIIKNYGRAAAASLAHGHQQIAFSNVAPQGILEDRRFEAARGEPFTSFLLRENPVELLLKDYGEAILAVPYFMKRPYDMLLIVKDPTKHGLHALSDSEIAALAEGWHDAARALHKIMPQIGREIAFNITAHNGPGAGIYFEFLPFTQETGGFEQLGLFICQENPEGAAARLQAVLRGHDVGQT